MIDNILMQDLYEGIKKSMFGYFCKHHKNLIEERFKVPRRLKITKKSFRNVSISSNNLSSDISNHLPSKNELSQSNNFNEEKRR